MTMHTRMLRQRVEALHGPLHTIAAPTTVEQARELARTDPDRFNALMEAGRIPASALGGQEVTR